MRKLLLWSGLTLALGACHQSEPGKALDATSRPPALKTNTDPAGRFTVYQPPQGMGEQAGEPTLGYNPTSAWRRV